VGANLFSADSEIIDVKGKIVTPGLIDMHCHLREPGQEYKEDIKSGTRSAAIGGYTSVACMPNTEPVVDNSSVVRLIKSRKAYTNVYPIGALTKGLEGKELAEIGTMKQEGLVAVSDDGHTVADASLMRKAMWYASDFDLPVIDHCEDKSLAHGMMNEGYWSTYLGLRGINRAAEEIIIARNIALAEADELQIHIAHVTTRGGIEMIRQAKKRGVRVTAETCPHYFSLTDEACEDFNTLAKVNPPLRTADDVAAVKEGLADGTIDAIVTDHAPHHNDEKNLEFALAKFGTVGFETAFALSYTNLVKAKVLTLPEVIAKLTYTPAQILKIPKGTLDVGAAADVTIFDIDAKFTVEAEKLHSKSKNTAFGGLELQGKAVMTIVSGKIVAKDGEVTE
jgi:dihydroorotase